MRIVKLTIDGHSVFHWWPVIVWSERPGGYALYLAAWGYALILINIDMTVIGAKDE